jgi:two-component system, OmpR family, sensor histidine kinase BaeS
MQTVRRRLSIILVACSIIAVILSALFVNITITRTFSSYIEDIQDRRNVRLVEYFQQIYKRDGQWHSNSGSEVAHEAYMSNFCLTLLDDKENIVWSMDPNNIRYKHHMTLSGRKIEGVYTSNTFDIVVDGETVGYLMLGQYSPVLLSKEDVLFKANVNRSIVFSVVLTITITVIISLIISKQFSSPIKAVAETSVRLSEGDYEARLQEKSSIKEIDNLMYSINSLGDKLNNQDLLRKRLISDISHEIRTPLNILQNNLEAMVDGYIPATKEKLNSLNDEVIRFGKLLNNLNALKQLEGEDVSLHLEQVEIDKVVSSVVSDFSIAAADKDIKIVVEKAGKKGFAILGDEDKLKQVFINIISNAIKFTKTEGNVLVNISSSADFVVVKVKDNGIGIKNEDLPFIFERMYRGDKSRHRIEGSGIGLTIAKKILSIHSASIEIESIEGKGTEVQIKFRRNINTSN